MQCNNKNTLGLKTDLSQPNPIRFTDLNFIELTCLNFIKAYSYAE